MREFNDAKPSRPVAFLTVLCLLMLAGEVWFRGGGNPMALQFYCSLPVVLWMVTQKQKRDAAAIAALEARIDRLEARPSGTPLSKAG